MMIFVGKSYVATPYEGNLAGLDILNRLGIGYIVTRVAEARVVLEPDVARLGIRDLEGFVRQVRSRAQLLLAWREYTGTKEFKRGQLKDVFVWVAHSINGEIQHNAFQSDDEFRSGLNIEHKDTLRSMLRGWREDRTRELADVLHALPDAYELRVWPIDTLGREEGDLINSQANRVTSGDLESLIQKMKETLDRPQWKPHISLNRPLWSVIENMHRETALRLLREIRADIDRVVSCISAEPPGVP